jgi:uncharacterized protein YndB with AHSA1/START domain
MSAATETDVATTQVFRVFIKATPQAIWDAITKPEWNERYGYPGRGEYDLRPGGAYRGIGTPEMGVEGIGDDLVVVEGEVIEVDPPRKLVQTWRMKFTPEMTAEPLTRVTWEIVTEFDGLSRLTVTHDLEGAPIHAMQVAGAAPLEQGGGGWALILSDLKSVLETGKSFSE